MASKFGYRLTKRAESDLDGIVSYIATIKQKLLKDAIDKNEDDSYLKTLPYRYHILKIANEYQTVFYIAKNMLEKRLLYTAFRVAYLKRRYA